MGVSFLNSFTSASNPLETFSELFHSMKKEPATYGFRVKNQMPILPVEISVVPPEATIQFTNALLEKLPAALAKRTTVVLWNAFGVKNRVLLATILPDDVTSEELRRTLKAFHEVYQNEKHKLDEVLADYPVQMPAVISASGFRAWLTTQPFENYEFLSRGRVLHGHPPERVPITFEDCVDCITNEYLSLLTLQNHWKAGPAETAKLLRELMDQMHVYLKCLREKSIELYYFEQKNVSRANADVDELYIKFNTVLLELRTAILDSLGFYRSDLLKSPPVAALPNKRIAIEATQAFKHPRGWGRYSRELLRSLQKASGNVDYTFFYHDDRSTRYVCEPEIGGTQTSFYPLALSKEAFLQIEEDFSRSFIDEALKPDLYHSLTEFPWYTHKGKLVVTIHELSAYLFPNEFSPWFAKEFKKYIEYSVERADALVAVSNRTREDILKHFKVDDSKVHVIPNGVSEIFKSDFLTEKSSFPYVLYVGSVNKPTKNARALLTVLENLPVDYRLILICNEHTVSSLCEHLNIPERFKERIELLAYVTDERLSQIYRGASLLIFPSYYEGFGLPVFEALASGCPVLCAFNPATSELAKDFCVFFDPFSPSELRQKLKQCLEGYDSSLQSKGAEFVRNHLSWDHAAKAYSSLYEKMLQ